MEISHLAEEQLTTLHFFNKRMGLLRPSQVTSLRIKRTLSLDQQNFSGTRIPFHSKLTGGKHVAITEHKKRNSFTKNVMSTE